MLTGKTFYRCQWFVTSCEQRTDEILVCRVYLRKLWLTSTAASSHLHISLGQRATLPTHDFSPGSVRHCAPLSHPAVPPILLSLLRMSWCSLTKLSSFQEAFWRHQSANQTRAVVVLLHVCVRASFETLSVKGMSADEVESPGGTVPSNRSGVWLALMITTAHAVFVLWLRGLMWVTWRYSVLREGGLSGDCNFTPDVILKFHTWMSVDTDNVISAGYEWYVLSLFIL